MNPIRRILGISLLVFFVVIGGVQAQDDVESPTPEVTEVATEVAPVVEVTTDVTPVVSDTTEGEPDVTIINNNGFSFQEVLILIFGFVLTIFAGARMFLMPALKANAELAKAAGTYVPQETFDKVIGVTTGLQQWALTLTPNWTGDDEGLAKLRAEFEDWKNLLHPSGETPNISG